MKFINLFIIKIVLLQAILSWVSTALGSGELLLDAVRSGELKQVIEFLDAGVDVNYSPAPLNSNQLSSPLTVAIAENQNEIIQALLARKPNVNQFGQGNGTPLMHAAIRGDFDLVAHLLELGADPNAQNPGVYSGSMAIHWAVLGGSERVVDLLLKNGANPSAKNDNNEVPLVMAMETNKLELARLLLKKGADPHQQDVWSSSLLTSETPFRLSKRLLDQRVAQCRPIIPLLKIRALMSQPQFLKLEAALEDAGRGAEYARSTTDSVFNRMVGDCSTGRIPQVKSLQVLCMETLLK